MPNIQFKYIYSENYNPQYVNGSVGSVDPLGEITLNFYHERAPIPKVEIREISAEGTPLQDFRLEPNSLDSIIVRYITSGITMNHAAAKAIHTMLGEQLEKIEKELKNG